MLRENPIFLEFYKFKTRHPRLVMTALVFFIIPIFTTAALSYAMKSDVTTYIPTVIVDHDGTQFSRDFSEFVANSEYFNVIDRTESDEVLEEMIKNGDAYAGIIIPENFYSDMISGKAPKILSIYDGSALTVLTTSKSAMSEIVLTVKGAYMKNVFHGKLNATPESVMGYVSPISVDYKVMFNTTKSFRAYLLVGMLVSILQVGMSMQGAERGFESQLRKRTFAEHLKAVGFNVLMSVISLSMILLMEIIFFGLSLKGDLLGGYVLLLLYVVSISGFGYLIGAVVPDRVFAIQIAAVLVLPTTLLCGYTYPIYGMPAGYVFLAKTIPFYHYGNVVRNWILKPVEFRHLLPDIEFFLIYIAVEFVLLIGVYLWQNRKNNRGIKGENVAEVASE